MHPSDLTLGEYVDGSLPAGERAVVAGHLERCRTCRALVDDFTELGGAAAALGPMEPPARTWTRIEETLREPAGRRPAGSGRRSSAIWLALAASLVLVTAASVWLIRVAPGTETPPTIEAATAQAIEAELAQAEEHYQKAISGLEQIANAEKGALDPATAATLQENIGVVDQAITESRAALKTQPASEPAQRSLLDSFRAKIELLQNTIALINDMRTGDDAGAAQVISRLKRGN
jgi:anti-sigma factor RsiW